MSTNNDQLSEVLLTLPEVEITSKITSDTHFLLFEFRNHFSTQAAKEASRCWVDYHLDHPESAIHIWHCRRMSGFDMAAKKIWMTQMKESSDVIERIILVSDMILIRGAARLMSKFSKHQLDVYRSSEELEFKEGISLVATEETSNVDY